MASFLKSCLFFRSEAGIRALVSNSLDLTQALTEKLKEDRDSFFLPQQYLPSSQNVAGLVSKSTTQPVYQEPSDIGRLDPSNFIININPAPSTPAQSSVFDRQQSLMPKLTRQASSAPALDRLATMVGPSLVRQASSTGAPALVRQASALVVSVEAPSTSPSLLRQSSAVAAAPAIDQKVSSAVSAVADPLFRARQACAAATSAAESYKLSLEVAPPALDFSKLAVFCGSQRKLFDAFSSPMGAYDYFGAAPFALLQAAKGNERIDQGPVANASVSLPPNRMSSSFSSTNFPSSTAQLTTLGRGTGINLPTTSSYVNTSNQTVTGSRPSALCSMLDQGLVSINFPLFWRTRQGLSLLTRLDRSQINRLYVDGWTPLCSAVQRGMSSMVTLLLMRGANPTLPCAFGPPLLVAAFRGDAACVALLAKASLGKISCATFSSFLRVVFDRATGKVAATATAAASVSSHPTTITTRAGREAVSEMLGALLSSGVAPQDMANSDISPLHLTASAGDIVQTVLLAQKLDVNAQERHSLRTPVHMALEADNILVCIM
jgi:hypothetical protein